MASKITNLEKIANAQRVEHIARNIYNTADKYTAEHKNAISDGDEKGKGENANQIGSLTDINTRTSNVVKNIYQKDKKYSAEHKNALSDGDEKGKGELNYSIGSSVDIKERTFEIARNEYNEKKRYPDFEI